MKKTLQTIAIVLAIGATIQSLAVYAYEEEVLSIENEELILEKLISLRKEAALNGDNASEQFQALGQEFSSIQNRNQLNDAIAKQSFRYIQAIGAEESLLKIVKKFNKQSRRKGNEPGI